MSTKNREESKPSNTDIRVPYILYKRYLKIKHKGSYISFSELCRDAARRFLDELEKEEKAD